MYKMGEKIPVKEQQYCKLTCATVCPVIGTEPEIASFFLKEQASVQVVLNSLYVCRALCLSLATY